MALFVNVDSISKILHFILESTASGCYSIRDSKTALSANVILRASVEVDESAQGAGAYWAERGMMVVSHTAGLCRTVDSLCPVATTLIDADGILHRFTGILGRTSHALLACAALVGPGSRDRGSFSDKITPFA